MTSRRQRVAELQEEAADGASEVEAPEEMEADLPVEYPRPASHQCQCGPGPHLDHEDNCPVWIHRAEARTALNAVPDTLQGAKRPDLDRESLQAAYQAGRESVITPDELGRVFSRGVAAGREKEREYHDNPPRPIMPPPRIVTIPGDEFEAAEVGVRLLLDAIADDPCRDGIEDTPARVVKAYREMTAGYDIDVEALLARQFEEVQYDTMIVLRRIQFVSLCEHHLLPFVGQASVGYIPGEPAEDEGVSVVGLSKLARLVEAYAMRLQLQERMTVQITTALDEYMHTRGSACVIASTHSCMGMRGVKKPGAEMVTSSTTGLFRDDGRTRQEFMSLAGLTV